MSNMDNELEAAMFATARKPLVSPCKLNRSKARSFRALEAIGELPIVKALQTLGVMYEAMRVKSEFCRFEDSVNRSVVMANHLPPSCTTVASARRLQELQPGDYIDEKTASASLATDRLRSTLDTMQRVQFERGVTAGAGCPTLLNVADGRGG
jgi:hypothetical protein